ncbi:hypothetical protein PV328_004065 [Microctonus aethiopoides]|uniref:Uncharacterized protein n=1 Tax=Microctonus aethiopoides TaxID=144406 RepID=A0AA39F9Z4_9HYME|nr:hypothetical protein PV328_004065 [Microctonus aethiopoides]
MLCKSALDALVNLLRVVMAGQNMVVNTIESHDSNVQNNDSNSRLEEDIQHYKDEGSRCFNIQNFFYEFATLNSQLDQINSILDTLEMKNDIIHAEFVELLKSNREARQQFQESVKNGMTQQKETNYQ